MMGLWLCPSLSSCDLFLRVRFFQNSALAQPLLFCLLPQLFILWGNVAANFILVGWVIPESSQREQTESMNCA